jgi:pyruvyltransferase
VSADLISVGSLLHLLPQDWSGIVAGSGTLFENTPRRFNNAQVLGVRGPLTARGMRNAGTLAIGDPGLLANELVVAHKEHDLGLVPHWSDTDLEHRPEFKKYKPLIIRPDGDPKWVLRQIGSCRKIVSSSLHGIIVADAFGIPRRTETTPRFLKEGGDWKFRDHNAAVGVPFELGKTQEAPRWMVQDRKHEIYDMLRAVGDLLRKAS